MQATCEPLDKLVESLEIEVEIEIVTRASSGSTYDVTIKRGDHSYQTTFSQGSAFTEDPTPAAVLAAVALDAATYDNEPDLTDFVVEWTDMGVSIGLARSMYEGCKKAREGLRTMLHHRQYDQLLRIAQEF